MVKVPDMDYLDLRVMPFDERKQILDKWFQHYLGCNNNIKGGHRWIDPQYIGELKVWTARCEYCGHRKIWQTVGNHIRLFPDGSIETYLIFNDDFADPHRIREETMKHLGKTS